MSPSALNLLTQTFLATESALWQTNICLFLEIATEMLTAFYMYFAYVVVVVVKLPRAPAESKSREVALPGGWDIYSRCLQNLHTDLQCPTYG